MNPSASAMKPYNIILISVDCWRHDRFNPKSTPNIHEFSKKCYVFNNFFSNGPWTPPSFNSIMTSTYPFMYTDYSPLPRQKKTFAEVLKKNGYLSIYINSNIYASKYFGYDRGFDITIETGEQSRLFNVIVKIRDGIAKLLPKTGKILRLFDILDRMNDTKDLDASVKVQAAEIVEKIIYALNKLNISGIKKPFFAWTHFMDCHAPLIPPPRYLRKMGATINSKQIQIINKVHRRLNRMSEFGRLDRDYPVVRYIKQLYDAALLYIDEQIAKYLNFLDTRGFLHDTIVVITADHGELFLEHGFIEHPARMYDELLHVPMVIYIPPKMHDVLGKPRKIDKHASLIDLAPTILSLIGSRAPKGFVGKSFIPLFQGSDDSAFLPIISETYKKKNNRKTIESKDVDKLLSIRTKKWKYIHDTAGSDACHLFSMAPKIDEDNDLKEKFPEITRFFKKKAEAFIDGDYDIKDFSKEDQLIHKAIKKFHARF
ncbi:MAG: sulfatase [Promethearchaeota archaeon]